MQAGGVLCQHRSKRVVRAASHQAGPLDERREARVAASAQSGGGHAVLHTQCEGETSKRGERCAGGRHSLGKVIQRVPFEQREADVQQDGALRRMRILSHPARSLAPALTMTTLVYE
jgi:hypothetical protein